MCVLDRRESRIWWQDINLSKKLPEDRRIQKQKDLPKQVHYFISQNPHPPTTTLSHFILFNCVLNLMMVSACRHSFRKYSKRKPLSCLSLPTFFLAFPVALPVLTVALFMFHKTHLRNFQLLLKSLSMTHGMFCNFFVSVSCTLNGILSLQP